MMEKLMLTIFSFNNKGKRDEYTVTCDDMVSVTRHMMLYVPKRGYDPVEYRVRKEVVLV